MKRLGHSLRTKEKKFLRLYSLWQETRRDDLQKKCLGLLGQILRQKPGFSLRGEFNTAF